jgi:uncharacterized membrane protein
VPFPESDIKGGPVEPDRAGGTVAEEDRVLREWTPVLLRAILGVSVVLLVAGIIVMATRAPGYYVSRFHAAQHGRRMLVRGNWSEVFISARHGNPHSIMTLGLVTLTLVPLGRVAFTFLLFLKERDTPYVIATAYVLAGLIFGVMLGRIG